MDSSTASNSLIGVDGFIRGFAEEIRNNLLDEGDTSRTTDKKNFIDFILSKTRILEALLAGLDGLLEELSCKSFEFSSSHLDIAMFRARSISSQIRKIDLCGVSSRELAFSFLSGFSNSLDSHLIAVDIDTTGSLEFLDDELSDHTIDIFSTARSISVSSLNFEHTLAQFQNGNIESTTTEIVDGNNLALGLLHTVSQSGSSGFVDNSLHSETSNFTSVLGGLSLLIVEISGHSDDGALDCLAEVSFSGFFHFGKNERSDLRRRVVLASSGNPSITIRVTDNLVG